MTYTKLGAEFSDDAANADLSDAAFRTHVEAIQWLFTVERMDCHVPARLVRRFAGSPHGEMAVTELVNLGWWRVEQQGYDVIHHADVVRGGIVAQQKKRERDKKAQQSHRDRQSKGSDVSDDAVADVSDYPDRQTTRQLQGNESQREIEQQTDDPRFWKTAAETRNERSTAS
jgi:hypothetical protein